jgi:endothelin-converting enzyme
LLLQVGVLLNSEANPNRTRRHMRDIIEFEIRIAKITVSNAERRDEEKLYHNITIADLHNLAPFVIIKLIL